MIIPVTTVWSCLTASFSMASGIPHSQLIQEIGHDGGNCPYLESRYRAGFHVQECIEVLDKYGWTCTPIELLPVITPDNVEFREIYFGQGMNDNWQRFLRHLDSCKQGVIEGQRVSGIGHAVAWNGTYIYDPIGKSYSISECRANNLRLNRLWKLEKRNEAGIL